jgi:hypothetical protein
MTAQTMPIPTDVTQLPCGPDYIEVEPVHLSITGLRSISR